MSKTQTANVELGLHRRSLEATIIRACRNCGAPGLYQKTEAFREKYPKVYSPERFGQPVGDVCPQCGADRPADKDLGELTSSMPRWVWKLVLAFKWCLIKWKTFTSKRSKS